MQPRSQSGKRSGRFPGGIFFNKMNELFQLDSTRRGEQASGCEEEGGVACCTAGARSAEFVKIGEREQGRDEVG